MIWIRNAWNNFKAQPEIWFFYGFILTSPLSIRKVFFDYPLLGEFNEYSGIYLYLSDIFLALAFGAWGISILYNKYYNLSISNLRSVSPQKESSTPVGMFHGEHPTGQAWNFLRGKRKIKVIILGLPALLVLWSFMTIFWSNQPEIAIFRSFKLFEFYLLYLFLALNPHTKTLGEKHFGVGVNPKCSVPASPHGEHPTGQAWKILRNAVCIIIAVGLINAIIGILQVIIQHSLGLFWLKESLISPNLPGVAKIILGGTEYIRAYGLFPHPNILGGFLFLSIILTLAYWGLFHPRRNVPRGTSYGAGVKQSRPACATRCASWDNDQCKIYSAQNSFSTDHNCFTWNNYGRYNRYIFALILGIQMVAGILTFSKSAILGLILALAYMHRHRIGKMFHPSQNVPRGTFDGASVEHFSILRNKKLKKGFFAMIIIGLGIYLIRPDFASLFIKSLTERLVYINISVSMISGNFLAGIGSGQFVLEMQKYSSQLLLDWQFQPVHNVFLLIWSELGLIGFSLFTWFFWRMFHMEQAEQGPELKNVPRLPRETSLFHVEQTGFLRGGTTEHWINLQTTFKALLIGFLAIALFDHYLWDIQQGQIMLWMVLGFLANATIHNNLTK